ncbi:LysR substrate-binding domain-containing protein [Streptomyces sp. NPDC087917]|uniref:LysR substrate-binding domain-containing protein n=1 Tax=Streptomyces sp. NPDC087917 TaxID=3155060 RepID=UPI003440D2F4
MAARDPRQLHAPHAHRNPLADRQSDIRHRLTGKDRPVVFVRPGHPLTEGTASLDRYAAAEHLTVSRRGNLRDPIDDALTARALERRAVVAGPTAAFAPQLALDTALVVTLPDAVTRAARARLGLATLPLPLRSPRILPSLLWHRRYDDDRGITYVGRRDDLTCGARGLRPVAGQRPCRWWASGLRSWVLQAARARPLP